MEAGRRMEGAGMMYRHDRRHCDNCGWPNPPDADFCTGCNTPFPGTIPPEVLRLMLRRYMKRRR